MHVAQPCALCGLRSTQGMLCGGCWEAMPWLSRERCPSCALPTPGGHTCGACVKQPPHFDSTWAAVSYSHPLSSLLHAYKYRHQVGLARVLVAMMRRDGAVPAVQGYVVPMPATLERMRQRGFNQAAELSKALARGLGLPVTLTSLRKIRETRAQIELPWEQRRANVRDAFACDGALAQQAVILVDDVMTTGATADEAARTLKRAGASAVHVWVLARALPL